MDERRVITNGSGPVAVVAYKRVTMEEGVIVLELVGRGKSLPEAHLRCERLFLQVCSEPGRWI